MYRNRKVVVVLPAYNAEKTLQQTHREIVEQAWVDEIILVDDASGDSTADLAASLPGVHVFRHERNRGYGGNQKTCYREALALGADIVVMVHPDYQYTPKLIPAMVSLIGNDLYPCVLGSRILGGQALRQGMPWWRYLANRLLTLSQNLMTGAKLSEYHTGYRAFSADLLRSLDLDRYSEDFLFDNQMLLGIIWQRHIIAEVSCPTRYSDDASSINFRRSVIYGLGCLREGLRFFLARLGLPSSDYSRRPKPGS